VRRFGQTHTPGLGRPDAAEVARRLAVVRDAKRARAARGLPIDLTPADLDALGLEPIDCARTRERLARAEVRS
jgi:hypothetical protein